MHTRVRTGMLPWTKPSCFKSLKKLRQSPSHQQWGKPFQDHLLMQEFYIHLPHTHYNLVNPTISTPRHQRPVINRQVIK